jgi:hypothetical protein
MGRWPLPDFSDVQTTRIQYIAIGLCVILIASVIGLIRKGRLREEYAFIWFGSALTLLFFSVFRRAFDAVARFLGIAYGPSFLLLVILFSGFLFLVHFSIVISRLTEENKRLAQEVAILQKLAEKTDPDRGGRQR